MQNFILRKQKTKKHYICGGEMAEWSIAAVLKTVVRATGPGVRIPLSPLTIALLFRL
jgi:hypothetical protein